MVFAVFAPSWRNGFINLDDDRFIYENAQVRQGLDAGTALWALGSTEHSNWYPLTRLSHLADASLFGLEAGWHHLESAAWHAAAAALLFLALRAMTGMLWRSLAVAALFGVHPLQVESVAWASERSMVLAGFFFAGTLLLWTRYAARPGAGRLVAVTAAFACALAAKPVPVTLPFVLLLLDFWPLGRLGRARSPWRVEAGALGRRLLEKAPLFALAAGSALLTLRAQTEGGALGLLERLPATARLENAALSYARYLGRIFLPVDLAVLYPHPGRDLAIGAVVLSGVLIAALTALALALARRRPWLVVGWFWFLGTLVPAIGLVQVGVQSMADRYVYLPLAGVALAVAWEAAVRLRGLRGAAPALLAAALTAAAAATVVQVGLWRESRTLYEHALAVTSENWVIEGNLGMALHQAGAREEGVRHYREALRLRPEYAQARFNLGVALAEEGLYDEAATQLREAVRLSPDRGQAHAILGTVLMAQRRSAEAEPHLREAARLQPGDAAVRANLGLALLDLGRFGEAEQFYREALRLDPALAGAHNGLAALLERTGRPEEAAGHLREAGRLRGSR